MTSDNIRAVSVWLQTRLDSNDDEVKKASKTLLECANEFDRWKQSSDSFAESLTNLLASMNSCRKQIKKAMELELK